MTPSDACVTITSGVADVSVDSPGIVIEVRDYDVDGVEDELLWTDERGERCVRYFAEHDPSATS